ncbi:HAMP domain-containing sensor histidine kinase [Romboutsia sedimentorum]|uniref:sensor histidine kinase n=1 Tax=Romboutsia sedimentorum TaxID=1368474 RepID=UPI0024DEBA50|nr:HAMP domain-containing sensor histidine kinase [Romboutsia sedimentorum]MDK2584695.1 HAMP domain-containing sensor histidine kinase [Romboutsia sedimentorum]
MKKIKKKVSIKTRILASILGLLVIIFLGIILSFNTLVNTYIEKNSNSELRKATGLVEHFDKSLIPEKPPKEKPMPKEFESHEYEKNEFPEFMKGALEKVKMAEMNSNAEAMVIDSNYNLEFPTREEDFFRDINEYENILNQIKHEKINLNNNENFKIATNSGRYYASILKIQSIESKEISEENYLVLFIDISSTLNLANQINTVLIAVMCIAGILAILTAIILSNKIAKPIQQLCGFAKNIGKGDFSKSEFDFSDSELDELSQIMNKSVQYLDKYDKEQKIFFQNASHELRTPLMSIKGYAEAIKYNVIDKNSASDIILEESNRLSDMVEELLYISKIDNITKDYNLIDCDMREILSNCTLKQKARAMSKGIEFKYDFDEDEVMLNCDEKSMHRAFLNIIENALRYANSQIIIGCKSLDENIIIYIEDDGEGINDGDLNHVFDRFYKGNKGKNGIGLSIVKSIIEKHNGNVYAQNTDLGAKFTVFINNENNN